MSLSSLVPGVPSTSVPPVRFTPQGVILPNDSDILAGVQEDINYAFGGGVNPQLSSPQGQLASSEAAIISDKNSEIAYISNQMDPQYASGRFQDAIGRYYFMTRKPATSTVVGCVLTGPPSTTKAGTLAKDTSDNIYVLLADATIGSGGTVMSSWANTETGPIPCPANTLTVVYQSVPFDAITNPTDGVLGQDVESQQEFEYRRKQSVAVNGSGTVPAIQARVFGVTNVLDCYVIDNPAGTTVDKGSTNYPLVPHSLYVAVVGGNAQDIANAIWNRKNTGCDYNGNTSVTVQDTSDYEYPYPTYTVKFEIPSPLSILFDVQIVNSTSLPSNIVTLVQNAIIAQFNGTNGGSRARIGSLILATAYYGPIASVAPNLQLLSCTVGVDVDAMGASYLVGIDQTPSISAGNISVTLV